MAVTAVFNTLTSEGIPQLSVENSISPKQVLYLRGTALIDNHGMIIAELVQDQDERLYWKPNETFSRSNELFQEIAIVGQGRINL